MLPSIFLFSLTGINLYFIGLLYFSMRYVASHKAYRKSGSMLLVFTSFFIWIKYLWEYARKDFILYTGQDYSNIVKFLDMLTFSEVKAPKIDPNTKDPNAAGNDYIKQLFPIEIQIPITQWAILLIMFGLFTVNRLFKKGKMDKNGKMLEKIEGECYDGKDTVKLFESQAEKYEERNDYHLSRKFPYLSRVGIRLRMIVSEVGIMTLIICQTLILVFQDPNLLYWVFLILSLILQISVVASSDATP